jgi:hypothetical protein
LTKTHGLHKVAKAFSRPSANLASGDKHLENHNNNFDLESKGFYHAVTSQTFFTDRQGITYWPVTIVEAFVGQKIKRNHYCFVSNVTKEIRFLRMHGFDAILHVQGGSAYKSKSVDYKIYAVFSAKLFFKTFFQQNSL